MTSGRVKHLSLAAPAYNEAEGLETVIRQWDEYLANYPGLISYEIVICNDGSKDDTGALLDRLAREISSLKPVHFSQNQGAAAALNNAIRHTTADWVLLIDSDGQFPIDNLERLQAALEPGNKAAIGVRARKNDGLGARFGTWSSGLICNIIYGTRLRDFNSALKLVDGRLLRSLGLEAKGLNYSTEVTAKILERGESFVETEITHQKRLAGTSSMKFVRGSFHRFAFIFYLAVRRSLFALGIIQPTGSN